MTNEETLRLAKEAGFSVHEGMAWGGASDLRRFADAAVKFEREACAKVCEEMGGHWSAYKDTALLNGDVALSIAASGEPRAAESLAMLIRARSSSGTCI